MAGLTKASYVIYLEASGWLPTRERDTPTYSRSVDISSTWWRIGDVNIQQGYNAKLTSARERY
jgi:hypothetical protein